MAWQQTITTTGLELHAQAVGGELDIEYAVLGAGSVAADSLEHQTSVLDPIKTVSVPQSYAEGNITKQIVSIDNSGISADTAVTQIGLYASVNGGEAVLYAIAQTDIPINLYTTSLPLGSYKLDLLFEIAHNGIVSIISNFVPAGIVTQAQLELALAHLGVIVLSETQPTTDYKLWLEDLGDAADPVNPNPPPSGLDEVTVETAPYDANADYSAVSLDGGDDESIENMTDNPGSASDSDIIEQPL